MSQLTALITGASCGIGREIARLHAADKYDLLLVARDEKSMQMLKKELLAKHDITIHVYSLDLTVPESIDHLIAFIEKYNIRVDHLVNCAGMGVYGKTQDTTLEQNLKLIDLNVRALATLTHVFAQKMVAHGSGKILNVASTAAFMPGPYMASYFASKAFVLSYSEAVNTDLNGTGVSVTTLCPGPTETGFVKATSGMEYSGLFAKQQVSSAAQVAKEGYNAMMNQSTLKIPGLLNKIMAFSVRLAPRFMVNAITKNVNQPMR